MTTNVHSFKDKYLTQNQIYAMRYFKWYQYTYGMDIVYEISSGRGSTRIQYVSRIGSYRDRFRLTQGDVDLYSARMLAEIEVAQRDNRPVSMPEFSWDWVINA